MSMKMSNRILEYMRTSHKKILNHHTRTHFYSIGDAVNDEMCYGTLTVLGQAGITMCFDAGKGDGRILIWFACCLSICVYMPQDFGGSFSYNSTILLVKSLVFMKQSRSCPIKF